MIFCSPKMPRLKLEIKSKIIQLFNEKWPISDIIDVTEVPGS